MLPGAAVSMDSIRTRTAQVQGARASFMNRRGETDTQCAKTGPCVTYAFEGQLGLLGDTWLLGESCGLWRASLEAGGKLAPKEVERFTKELDPYVVLAVADGQIGIAASVNFAEPDLLKSAVTIEDARGKLLSALPDDKVSGGVRNLTQMMRPVLGNMKGAGRRAGLD